MRVEDCRGSTGSWRGRRARNEIQEDDPKGRAPWNLSRRMFLETLLVIKWMPWLVRMQPEMKSRRPKPGVGPGIYPGSVRVGDCRGRTGSWRGRRARNETPSEPRFLTFLPTKDTLLALGCQPTKSEIAAPLPASWHSLPAHFGLRPVAATARLPNGPTLRPIAFFWE